MFTLVLNADGSYKFTLEGALDHSTQGEAIAVVGSSIYTLYSKKLVSVDPKLKEISGMEFDKYKRLWAINDSGDEPKL